MCDKIIGFKYKLLESIGEGSFGIVYKGVNIFTKETIAVKIEKNTAKNKMLKHETVICKYLNNIQGIPKVRWFDKQGKKIYIVDFGLSKKIRINKTHIDHKKNKKIVGSLNFCSINNMVGSECSRRDDLISLGYILLYLSIDNLPWENVRELDTIIEMKKMYTEIECSNNLKKYLNYCYLLKFNENPDYKYLKSIFTDGTKKQQKYNIELT